VAHSCRGLAGFWPDVGPLPTRQRLGLLVPPPPIPAPVSHAEFTHTHVSYVPVHTAPPWPHAQQIPGLCIMMSKSKAAFDGNHPDSM
jgi:hypothetical protein